MAILVTVAEYIDEARRLMQDREEPYRYSDGDIILSLNIGLLEARRLRPDLFLSSPTVPSYSVDGDIVAFDQQYRPALVEFIASNIMFEDEEEITDSRAAAFYAMFRQKLLGL